MVIGIPAGGNGKASASERSAERSRIRDAERILACLSIPTEKRLGFPERLEANPILGILYRSQL